MISLAPVACRGSPWPHAKRSQKASESLHAVQTAQPSRRRAGERRVRVGLRVQQLKSGGVWKSVAVLPASIVTPIHPGDPQYERQEVRTEFPLLLCPSAKGGGTRINLKTMPPPMGEERHRFPAKSSLQMHTILWTNRWLRLRSTRKHISQSHQ